MAQQDSGQERTEQPTPKRRQDAKDKGQIARSRELNTVMVLLTGAGAILMFGDSLVTGMGDVMREGFILQRAQIFNDAAGVDAFGHAALDMFQVLIPFFIAVAVAASLAPIALGGWSFSAKSLAWKWDKLDPVKGMGRIFAWRGLVELLKALAKFIVVFSGLIFLLWGKEGSFIGLGQEPVLQGMAHAGNLLAWALLTMSAALIVIAVVDVPFQIWDHTRQLKMTRQEIRDEMKDTEGKPEVRSKIRQLQQEAAQRRMMSDVPKADVIVTNPSHYAVALRYDQKNMGAPRVVAKGADLIAGHIRQLGLANDVPLLSAPPLARSLYYSTEIGHEIPSGLYRAVARVLAYVFQLDKSVSGSVGMPKEGDLPIPEDLRRDK